MQLHYHTADHIKLPLNKNLLGVLTSAHKLLCHLVLEMFAADVHACSQCVLYGKSLKKNVTEGLFGECAAGPK